MEEHNEEWLLSKGWEKIEGYKIDVSTIDDASDGKDIFYVGSIEDLDGINKCWFYSNEKYPDFGTDDIDEAIKYQEEDES